MQLKYLFSHLYLFNEDESLASPCVLAKVDYKKKTLESSEHTHKDKNS